MIIVNGDKIIDFAKFDTITTEPNFYKCSVVCIRREGKSEVKEYLASEISYDKANSIINAITNAVAEGNAVCKL